MLVMRYYNSFQFVFFSSSVCFMREYRCSMYAFAAVALSLVWELGSFRREGGAAGLLELAILI
jgi:hypothetical protein